MVEEKNCDTIAKLLHYKITKLNSYKKGLTISLGKISSE